jgi:tetratricopeptide (TPR) repeat protein
MRVIRSSLLVLSVLGVAVIVSQFTPWGAERVRPVAVTPLPRPAVSASEAEQRDRDIAFFAERADRDPLGAADRAKLAELYLQRARETGSTEDLSRAEKTARESLFLRAPHNGRARQLLASALLGQHRFSEALTEARVAANDYPDAPGIVALFGECQLEIGDYDGADSTFGSPVLRQAANELSVLPRLARWHEMEGRTDVARRLLERARDLARRDAHGLSGEQLAWFELRVGDFEMRHGRLDLADSALRAGLRIRPSDYRLLGTLARLELSRGRPTAAITAGEAAIARVLDPATLGTLADAYLELKDSARSEEYFHAMEVSVQHQPGSYHRAWSLWLLDHDRDVATVSRKVAEELRTRRDVYGLDLQAWALYKQRRFAQARRVITEALARKTEDPLLTRHAAAIDSALSREATAATRLSRADGGL